MKKTTCVFGVLCGFLFGCAETTSVPLYDEVAVFRRYPALRGKIMRAVDYRPPKGPAEERWVPDPERVLQVGDRIQIEVANHPDLSAERLVTPDGRVSVSSVGAILAKGKSVSAVEKEISAALRKKFRDVETAIRVAEKVHPPEGSVDVVGNRTPGRAVAFKVPPPLTGVLYDTSPFSGQTACLTQVLIVRPSENVVIVSDYYAYRNGGDERENVRLAPGDIIIATEMYPETEDGAADWAPVERFIKGELKREELVDLLRKSRRK